MSQIAPRPCVVAAVVIAFTLLAGAACAQTPAELRSGVVKITSVRDGLRRTGTGFIVHATQDALYIATASHVVEEDKAPRVAFLSDPNTDVVAALLKIEGGDPRGMALLVVREAAVRILREARVLSMAAANDLAPGDAVSAIGFPQGGGGWAVVPATVATREGRELVLSGSIAEGNSGGPLVKDGVVVGLVTSVQGQYARAIPAVIVRFTLEGWGVAPGAPRSGAAPAVAAPVPAPPMALPTPVPSPPMALPTPLPAPPPASGIDLSGRYTGALQGSVLQEQERCNLEVTMAQDGSTITGQYSNSCGDAGAFHGALVQQYVLGVTVSAVTGVHCELAMELIEAGKAMSGQYACRDGEEGMFSLRRK